MSGLLVKSTVIMRENLEEMNRRGVDDAGDPRRRGADARVRRGRLPAHLRRAALLREGRVRRPALMERIVARRGEARRARHEKASDAADAATERALEAAATDAPRRPRARRDRGRPAPAAPTSPQPERGRGARASRAAARHRLPRARRSSGRASFEAINLQSVLPYINETTLFQFQWGYRRKSKAVAPSTRSFIEEEVRPIYLELAKQCAEGEDPPAARRSTATGAACPRATRSCCSIPKDDGSEAARFTFPRQDGKQGLLHHRLLPRARRQARRRRAAGRDRRPARLATSRASGSRPIATRTTCTCTASRSRSPKASPSTSTARSAASSASPATTRARCSELFKQGYRGSRFSLRLPGVPEPGGPGDPARAARRRAHRHPAERGVPALARAVDVGARVPPPEREVLHDLGRRKLRHGGILGPALAC